MDWDPKKLLGITEGFVTENKGVEQTEGPPESRWLFGLCVNYLNMSDDTCGTGVGLQYETHNEVCALLENKVGDCLFNGKTQKRFMMLMPRGTYKSSIAKGLAIGCITRNPNIRILFVTHRQDFTKKSMQLLKFHFTKNPAFLEEFGEDWKPEFRENVWSDTQMTVARRTIPLIEPTVDTASLGRDMTGSHYDLIFADDLVQRENVKKLEQRDDVENYLFSLESMLDPGGTIIVTGTRWHVDDAYGRIIKADEQRISKGEKPRYDKYIRSCWDGPQGLFFPAKQTHEFLQEMRSGPGGARHFAANYENKPVADEDRVFDISNVNIMNFDLHKINNTNIVRLPTGEQYPVNITMAWDPAGMNPTRKSDYHGITVVGTDFADRWWVLVAAGWKDSVSGILERMCAQVAFYRPTKIIIENVGGYGLWIPMMQQKLREKGLSILIEEDKVGGQNKSTRIQMLEPRVRAGRLYVLPEQKSLIEQIDNFSAANELIHEDILDSLAKHEGRTQTARQRVPNAIDVLEFTKPEKDLFQKEFKEIAPGVVIHTNPEPKTPNSQNKAGNFGMKWQIP